jgi:hypothetical protein
MPKDRRDMKGYSAATPASTYAQWCYCMRLDTKPNLLVDTVTMIWFGR